jgi:uncharacterized membrane protein
MNALSIDSWLLFAHIGGAAVWLGGGVMLTLVASRARASADPAFIREFSRGLPQVALRSLTPAMFVALLSGIGLVVSRSRSFTELWVLLALASFVVAFIVGALFVSRTAMRLSRLAIEASIDVTAADSALGRWLMTYRLILAILVFLLWDMVFKPSF